jgi:tetratricopeptide (TPR) repeat protein
LQFSACQILLVCGFSFFLSSPAFGADAWEIEIRINDEIVLKDGSTIRGRIIPTDDPDIVRIKELKSNATRDVKRSDIANLKARRTPEMAMDEEIERAKTRSDPRATLRFVREALTRFGPVFKTKLVALLELEAKSRDPEVLACLVDLYLQIGRANEAYATSETLISVAPVRATSFTLRGQAYQAQGKMEQAGNDFAKAYKMAPDDSQVQVLYAIFLLTSGGDPQKAKDIFEKALAANPHNAQALCGRGLMQLREGEFNEAENDFQQALQYDPNLRPAAIGLANTRLLLKKYDDAYAQAEKILAKDTKCGEAYAAEALVKLCAGDKDSADSKNALEDAENKIKEALREKPNQPRLLQVWMEDLERQAQYQDALNTADSHDAAKKLREQAAAKYDELAAANPQDSCLQYFIGEKKFRAGDYAGAQDAFQRAAQLAPRYAAAFAALGASALKLEQWEAAQAAYRTAQEKDSACGEYYAGEALALLKKNCIEQAEKIFLKARDCDPNNITTLCGLGYIKNAEKDKAKTFEYFQQALAVDGSCAYAADALKKLYLQSEMLMDYLAPSDAAPPEGWKQRGGGHAVPIEAANGHILFSGKEGAAASSKIEFFKTIKGEDFVRLEADLEILPASPVTFGLRLGSVSGSTFEVEFGKDETTGIKLRYKDFQGQPEVWHSLNTDWPASGRVRLAVETDDLKSGRLWLWINGQKSSPFSLVLQKPGHITAGFFIQVPANEAVRAVVSDVVLVVRGVPTAADDKAAPEIGDLFNKKDEEKKPAPPPASPPAAAPAVAPAPAAGDEKDKPK